MLHVEHRANTQFDIVSGEHRVVTDQAREDGGDGAGMSPVELFVGSLASCVAYFVGRFCERHGTPQEGLRVEAEWSMAERPHRVGAVELTVVLPTAIPESHRERLLKVAHGCTVHQSLGVPLSVQIGLRSRGASETSG